MTPPRSPPPPPCRAAAEFQGTGSSSSRPGDTRGDEALTEAYLTPEQGQRSSRQMTPPTAPEASSRWPVRRLARRRLHHRRHPGRGPGSRAAGRRPLARRSPRGAGGPVVAALRGHPAGRGHRHRPQRRHARPEARRRPADATLLTRSRPPRYGSRGSSSGQHRQPHPGSRPGLASPWPPTGRPPPPQPATSGTSTRCQAARRGLARYGAAPPPGNSRMTTVSLTSSPAVRPPQSQAPPPTRSAASTAGSCWTLGSRSQPSPPRRTFAAPAEARPTVTAVLAAPGSATARRLTASHDCGRHPGPPVLPGIPPPPASPRRPRPATRRLVTPTETGPAQPEPPPVPAQRTAGHRKRRGDDVTAFLRSRQALTW